MKDGPGLSAWDLANERCAPLDITANARLDRELGLIRRGVRELGEKREPWLSTGEKPGWPGWAKPLGTVPEGGCQTCGEPLPHTTETRGRTNRTGICGACGHRLGGTMRRRVKLTLRMYREAHP